jgi:7,8-dihydroneopterin 2',3'-cyclic phosphate phosphodiesterase
VKRVSTSDRREMLLEEAEKIEDDDLREFVVDFLRDPRITFTDVEAKIKLEESPAAPKAHHSYPGGLIDHTVSVARIARRLASTFSSTYGFDVNEDFATAGALLHDIFKYYQYEYDEITGGFRQREDWYLSHDFAIVAELSFREANDYLIRIISEAHGNVLMRTPEGRVLHLADYVDYKMAADLQDAIYQACIDVERETNGKVLAIKLFNALMRNYTIFDLVPYVRGGRDVLIRFIKEEMGI